MVRAPLADPRELELPALPLPPTVLVGREREVEETLAMLARPEVRLLTLLGPGGVGKTRLALEVAHRLQEISAAGWFELATFREPHLVLDALARGLGASVSGAASPEAALVGHLREWRGVLVLDNLEQVLEVALPLARLLEGCPHLRLLVTSREPLRLRGEWHRRLLPLALPSGQPEDAGPPAPGPALDLFWSCVRRDEPGYVPSAREVLDAAELCRALGGLPLALELAASRVGRLGVSAVLAQVRAGRLPSSGARDLPERHRSLEAVVRWSYDLLTPGEQRALRRLSVFAGTWDADSAAPVWPEDEPGDLLDTALELADKHLVVATPTEDGVTFRLLDTIRTFALARLEESGEAGEVWGRLAGYVLATLRELQQEVNGPGAAQAIQRFTALEHDLREVLRRSLSRGDMALAFDLAGEAGQLWFLASRLTEGCYWLEQVRLAAERAGTAGPPLVTVLYWEGKLAFDQSNHRMAEAVWRLGLSLVSPQEEPRRHVQLLGNLGLVLRRLGHFEEGRALYEQTVIQLEAMDEPLLLAHMLYNLSSLHQEEGRLEDSLPLARRALEGYRSLGDERSVAKTEGHLGNVLMHVGQVEEGLVLLRRGYVALEALGDGRLSALILHFLGRAHHRLGQVTEARTALEQAATIFEALESHEDYVYTMEALAVLDADTARPAAAAWCVGHAGVLREEFDLPLLLPSEQTELDTFWTRVADDLGPEAERWRARGAAVPFGKGLAAYHAEAFPVLAGPSEPSGRQPPRETREVNLSAREAQVLACIARGLSNKELCRELGMSAFTARTHVTSILNKFGVHSRAHAVARATALGLLSQAG